MKRLASSLVLALFIGAVQAGFGQEGIQTPTPIPPAIEVDLPAPQIENPFQTVSDASGDLKFPTNGEKATAGPDLDFGFFNYVEVRLTISPGYKGDLLLSYLCSGPGAELGKGSSGEVRIPNAILHKDGLAHGYRIDMGLQPYWRGQLLNLKLGATGGTLNFTNARVDLGDMPNDHYYANKDCPGPKEAKFAPFHELESKHFRMVWSVSRENMFNAKQAEGCLRNAEEVWQYYVKALQLHEPCYSVTADKTQKYKVNLLNIFDGYWMGRSDGGYGYLNIDTSGLRADPASWVIPHEPFHVFQCHQGGNISGQWWECLANYGRERWLMYYAPFYFPDKSVVGERVSNLETGFPEMANWILPHGRDYYLCWPIFVYLDENPDHLSGLGNCITAKLLQQAAANETVFDTLNRLTNGSVSVADIVGLYARRNVTWDYQNQAAMEKNAPITGGDPQLRDFRREALTELDQLAEDPTCWQVPPDRAPEQFGYAIHELVPIPQKGGNNRVVSVNFRGVPDQTRGADWRASLVVVNDSGGQRYSRMWNSGVVSVTLAPNENKVFLVVAATPRYLESKFDDEDFPYQSDPSKQRFPYLVQLSGVIPWEEDNGPTAGLVQHPNGGGWKSHDASVDDTAFIGPNARVLDHAKVSRGARVEDFAVVEGQATVSDHAIISGHASIRDDAIVKDFAKVRDWAIVSAGAVISGEARILQHAHVRGTAFVSGSATVEGYSEVTRGKPGDYVGGDSVLMGEYMSGQTVLNGFQAGFLPYQGTLQKWIDDRKAPGNLFIDYESDPQNESLLKDYYGVTDGLLIGGPKYSSDRVKRSFLTFNGSGQYVTLPREAVDFHEATFSTWTSPDGGPALQPVFFSGYDLNHYWFVTMNNGQLHPQLVVKYPGVNLRLSSSDPLPLDWVHVAVVLDGQTAQLFIGGKRVASAPCVCTPDQFLGPNTTTGRQQNYLGRGITGLLPYYKGAITSFRVHSVAMTEPQIADDMINDPKPKPKVSTNSQSQ